VAGIKTYKTFLHLCRKRLRLSINTRVTVKSFAIAIRCLFANRAEHNNDIQLQ